MSRRAFLKWIGALIALAAGWGFWPKKAPPDPLIAEDIAAAATPSTEPSSTPTPQSTPQPTPAPTKNPPWNGSELLASFFLFSDMHISAGEASMTVKLKQALDDVTRFESPVQAIVFGGDLTDFGRDVDYKLLRSTLNQYKLPPLYANMGNHDYYDLWLTKDGAFSTETAPNGKTDAMARSRFMKFMGMDKPYGDVRLNGVHLIFVSQEVYVQEKPDVGEGAWYSDEQLAWLKEKMAEHRDGSPALVMIHQPFPAPGMDGRTHQLIRAQAFREIMKPYSNVFVFSGHTHRDFNSENHYNRQEQFHWFNNASVGRTRGPATAAQGMYIQVYGDRIAVRGREFSTREWIAAAKWEVPYEA